MGRIAFGFPLFILFSLLFWTPSGLAQNSTLADTFLVEGRYVMGDRDTRSDALQYALLDAKRKALEQAGTYLRARSTVENFMLTEQDIETLAAGLLRTEILEEYTEPSGESLVAVVKIRAVVLPADLDQLAQESAEDSLLKEQLSDLQRQYRDLLARVNQGQPNATGAEEGQKRQSWQKIASAEALYKLALEARKQRPDVHLARQLAEQAMVQSEFSRAAAGYLGIVLYKQGQVNAAMTQLQKAVQNNKPRELPVRRKPLPQRFKKEAALFHYYLALAWHQKGNQTRARMHLKLARRLDPGNAVFQKQPF